MFWLDDPYVLLTHDFNFNDKTGRLNTIFKIMIILSVLFILITKDVRYILIAILTGIFTVLLKMHYDREAFGKDNMFDDYEISIVDNKVCSTSTPNNPFMNPSIADIAFNPDRYEACDVELMNNKINKNFFKNVFKNANDIYGRDMSLRQFYTVPNTSIPNKQGELARWLYDRGQSCKEGNSERCIENIGYNRNELAGLF